MKSRLLLSASALTAAFLAPLAHGASITATGADTTVPDINSSSFTGAGHWSNSAAPAAGNTYTDSAFEMRTPQDTTNYTFGGDSLTIAGGGALTYKGLGSTITAGSLILNNGTVNNNNGGTSILTLAGNVSILSGGGTFRPNVGSGTSTIVITANLSGSGAVAFANSTTAGVTGVVQLSGNNSALSGAVSIGSSVLVDARVAGALGTSNITVAGGGTLKLELGTTSNYLGDTATLTLNSTSVLNLAFTGTDTIGALSLNGGSTFSSIGTWGAVGSGAQFTSSLITGTGFLNVTAVPEPGTWAMLGLGLGFLACFAGRRARVSA